MSLVARIFCWASLLLLCHSQGVLPNELEPSKREQFVQFQQALKNDPRNVQIRSEFGFWLMTQGGGSFKLMDAGTRLLEGAFDPKKSQQTLHQTNPLLACIAAATIGRFRYQFREHDTAEKFLEMAFEISKQIFDPKLLGEPCLHIQLATMLDYFPRSIQSADNSLARMNHHAEKLLEAFRLNQTKLNEEWISNIMPGASNDPYVHCCLTLFPLSFYYRADVANVAAQHYQISAFAWPELLYVAPHVQEYDDTLLKGRPCVDRKIRLGVVAATLSEGHSVTEDFGGVLSRLDRNIFEVTYIVIHESLSRNIADFITQHEQDKLFQFEQDHGQDLQRGAWPLRISKEIASLKLDVIFYLDMTMSSIVRRLGMGRLAPVQINTHGHPVTSGHPRTTVQHFVSWAEAELPFDEAQTHYTEELQLIPNGTIHQYYARRVLPGQISRMDGMAFGHLQRSDFNLPADVHLYVCMQKPFKLHPEFDELVCGILQRDLQGNAVLHRADSQRNHEIFLQRLENAGCDLKRVHFLDAQPNHRLMGLYVNAEVILDSYPAGGCTTTREALELGKAVITLPARLLGGRWSLGLYNILDLDPLAKHAVIANSEEEFIDKAVALGTNLTLRQHVESSIRECVPGLFARDEAVEEWQKILLRVSPVKPCQPSESNVFDEF